MTKQIKSVLIGVGTLLELGCIAVLGGIALKRNNDCYKAECELIDAQCELIYKDVVIINKNHKISMLEKELDELKKENVKETES